MDLHLIYNLVALNADLVKDAFEVHVALGLSVAANIALAAAIWRIVNVVTKRQVDHDKKIDELTKFYNGKLDAVDKKNLELQDRMWEFKQQFVDSFKDSMYITDNVRKSVDSIDNKIDKLLK